MNLELLAQLKNISAEEQRILDGDNTVQKSLYTSRDDFVIDSRKMLERGKLIDIRTHTRFIHFPKHRHNYIELIYMCSGSTLHLINDKTSILLETGDLLFLNQNVTQEILPAGIEDVAVNFMILPEFFNRTFLMVEDEHNLRDFLIGSLTQKKSMVDFIHFSAKNLLPVQNLMENMIWSLLNKQPNPRNITQTTMSLLFLELLNHSDQINKNDPLQYEQNLMFTALKYIEDHYQTASLDELAFLLNQPSYWVSKFIKKYSQQTFKQLVQHKRLSQATYLLTQTSLSVEDIIAIVGYDNTSYFHRLFREHYHMTPKTFRTIH